MTTYLNIGLEVNSTIAGKGVNQIVGPTTSQITLESLQLDCSLGFPSGAAGFSMVLVGIYLTTANPTFSSVSQQYCSGPFESGGFPNPTWINPNNLSVGGNSLVLSGQLFGSILKANAPEPVNRSCNIVLNKVVPAGYYFVFHIDGVGVPGDFEMQGSLGYV